mmetsp:Transcript_32302/g.102677  ORF Transcript_32302/g.102677 Transcript_32302/m.102677 type:complete len:91 (+) Transcript_32302:12-284(+)
MPTAVTNNVVPTKGNEVETFFDASNPAIGDMTIEELLESVYEKEVQRILAEAEKMQEKLREKANEAKEILLAKPTKENEEKLESLISICA